MKHNYVMSAIKPLNQIRAASGGKLKESDEKDLEKIEITIDSDADRMSQESMGIVYRELSKKLGFNAEPFYGIFIITRQ